MISRRRRMMTRSAGSEGHHSWLVASPRDHRVVPLEWTRTEWRVYVQFEHRVRIVEAL